MSVTLKLTKDNWKAEIESSSLPKRTKELLTKAFQAKILGTCPFPTVSEKEFDDIIYKQIFFLDFEPNGLILNKRIVRDGLHLILENAN